MERFYLTIVPPAARAKAKTRGGAKVRMTTLLAKTFSSSGIVLSKLCCE
jgi:hypothetical protein